MSDAKHKDSAQTGSSLNIPRESKDDIERAKLYLECLQLEERSKKNIWYYFKTIASIVPIATLIITSIILYRQNINEERRIDGEIAKEFAATVQNLDAESISSRLGSVLALENLMKRGENYRTQIYVLLGSKLKEETSQHLGSAHKNVLVNQILRTFRKVSRLRLKGNDLVVELLLESSEFDSLDLRDTDLRRASLKAASLRGALLDGSRLDYAVLSEASLMGTNLEKSQLNNAFLRNTILDKANLVGADLTGAIMVGAFLDSARLDRATLKQAQLQQATLRGASINDSNLEGASLKNAHLNGAILASSSLRDTDIEGTDLRGAIGLIPDSLIVSKNWDKAILDSGLLERLTKMSKQNSQI